MLIMKDYPYLQMAGFVLNVDMFPFNVIDDADYLNCIFNIIKGNTIDTCHIKNAQQLKLFSMLKPVDSNIDPLSQNYHVMTIIIVIRNLMIS